MPKDIPYENNLTSVIDTYERGDRILNIEYDRILFHSLLLNIRKKFRDAKMIYTFYSDDNILIFA